MLRKYLLIKFLLLGCLAVNAQTEQRPSSFSLVLNHDPAFGFYTYALGSYGLKNGVDNFTFYGIFWTNPGYGNPMLGTDLWLETGIGIGHPFAEGKGYVNPSLGFTHGKLLSGGTQGRAFEGIVPSITAFYTGNRFELEAFAAYYKSTRDQGITSDYVLYWAYPGIRLNKLLSLGLHLEGFDLTRLEDGSGAGLYFWTGGFVKFTLRDFYTLRFSAGKNHRKGDYAPDYYKLTVAFPLLAD